MSSDPTAGDAGPKGRQFDDREVALILKTAGELQQRDGGGGSGGLTLEELEQIAAEAGMDPALIGRAVRQIDGAGEGQRHNAFLGGPSEIVVERTVQGEIGEGAFEELLAVVRASTGDLGEMSAVGRLFGWRGRVAGVRGEASVVPGGGRTLVRVRLQLDEAVLGGFVLRAALGGLGGGVTAFGVTGGVLQALGATGVLLGSAAALVGVSIAGVGYLAARRMYARHGRAGVAAANALADGLAARVSALALPGVGPPC